MSTLTVRRMRTGCRIKVEVITAAEAALLACWMRPSEVAKFKLQLKKKGNQ
jgi:hypothetical protein